MRKALISRSALLHNYSYMRKASGVPVMALVKAQAYGHGAALVSRILQGSGCRHFGVATLEEALELRRAGIKGEILVVGGVEVGHLREAAAQRIGVTAWSRSFLKACSRHRLAIHLKVDTGMSRLGFAPEEMPSVLHDFGKLNLASGFTHFACADEKRDRASSPQLVDFLGVPWPAGLRLHAANSAAALRYKAARLDMVRSGIFLYGALDRGVVPGAERQRPVMRFSTRVLRVRGVPKGQGVSYGHTFKASRPTRVATLAAGYADGVRRPLGNRGEVLIGGRRCRILGRVCMDLAMADVSRVRARPGDEAVLIGRQGREEVTSNEWAALCGTNSYEILCGVSARVPRELGA